MQTKNSIAADSSKSSYATPKLVRVGAINKITLKTGSTTDSSMPRVV